MQKMEKERQQSPEEERYKIFTRSLKAAVRRNGGRNAVTLAADQDGMMRLEFETTGFWGIKIEGEDTYADYGLLDLETATHLYAYVTDPAFREIEDSMPASFGRMEEHLRMHGDRYQIGLLGAMDSAIQRPSR